MTTMSKIRFKKNSRTGAWELHGPSSELKPGPVTVQKSDGTTVQKNCREIRITFPDGNCIGSIAEDRPNETKAGRGDNLGGVCRMCRGVVRHAPHHRAMDGLCGDCAFDEYDM